MVNIATFWTWLRSRLRPSQGQRFSHANALTSYIPANTSAKVFVLVEGANDIQFLRRISAILHADSPDLPDLGALERKGEILFVPTGGGDLLPWTYRLAALGRAEFFLLDRELSPVTQVRLQLAEIVNLRPKCCAFVTRKRSLENYLHPAAIREARGIPSPIFRTMIRLPN